MACSTLRMPEIQRKGHSDEGSGIVRQEIEPLADQSPLEVIL
jgi:hypothetical protein